MMNGGALLKLSTFTAEEFEQVYKKSGLYYADTILKYLETLDLDSWGNIYSKNTANAKELGLLPCDLHVVRKTLEDYGFVIQSRKFTSQRPNVILDCIDTKDNPAYVIFANVSSYFGLCTSLIMKTNDGISYFDDLTPKIMRETGVALVWIRYSDGVNRSPAKRRKIKFRPLGTKLVKGVSNGYFTYYQPNPRGNNVGDCVVRALAGTMQKEWCLDINQAWCKALEVLCEPGTTTVINHQDYFSQILKSLGFTLVKPSKIRNGKEFCYYLDKTFYKGERIFAFIGKTHVAAIVPNAEGKYKILDFQDPSYLEVTSYWVI